MSNRDMADALEGMRVFREKLSALGIGPERMGEVTQLLEAYAEMRLDIKTYRQNQFFEDAKDLIFQTSGKRGDRTSEVAAFLRKFAEHVTRHVASPDRGELADVVDRIPAMHVPEER